MNTIQRENYIVNIAKKVKSIVDLVVSKDTCHVWTVFEGMDIAKESDPWSLCEKSCEENLDCLAAFPGRHGCFLAVDKTFCEDIPSIWSMQVTYLPLITIWLPTFSIHIAVGKWIVRACVEKNPGERWKLVAFEGWNCSFSTWYTI